MKSFVLLVLRFKWPTSSPLRVRSSLQFGIRPSRAEPCGIYFTMKGHSVIAAVSCIKVNQEGDMVPLRASSFIKIMSNFMIHSDILTFPVEY